MFYKRQLNPLGDDSLARLARKIPQGSRVLELGPATGYLTQYLSETLACTVDAIELSQPMANEARQWCRRMVVGDIELLDLATILGDEVYDVIVCADVIEHLRDPWSLVRRLGMLLKEDGRLLLSVPNVGYLGLLVDLLRGRFNYRDEGLLDRSHLRFFTLDSLRDLLNDAGWHIWAAEPVELGLTDSEFRLRLETLAPALRDELMSRSDALCYQWVVEARRHPPKTTFVPPSVLPEDRFQVRLFWRGEEQEFAYPRDQLVWGRLGVQHQMLEFRIPIGQVGLSLSLTDRIGFIQLHEVTLFAEGNVPLWKWQTGMPTFPQHETRGVEFGGSPGLWFVHESESRLTLELPPSLVAIARCLRVELDAPVTADYLNAKKFWESPDGLPARLAACEASRRRLVRRRGAETENVDESSMPRPAILHILPACGGGIERFVRDLSGATIGNWRHFALRVTKASWWLEEMESASHWPLSSTRRAEIVEALAALRPLCVHLHTVDPIVVGVAQEIISHCPASLVVTLHDVLFIDSAAFSGCYWNENSVKPDQAKQKLLQTAHVVTVPSYFLTDLASRHLGIEAVEISNGIDMAARLPWDDSVRVEIGGKCWLRRIAVLGALGRHKGGERIFDIAAALPSDIVLVIIGFLDGQLETGWACDHHRFLAGHPGANRIFVTGPYAPGDLPALFGFYCPQLFLFPGNVPESFSYTLSEVWSLGGIPVVPSVGALGERAHPDCAVRFDASTHTLELAALLDYWCSVEATERRSSLRQFIQSNLLQLVPTLADMAKAFSDLYQELSDVKPAVFDARVLDKFSQLCELNLDPAQFRTELRLMMEINQALRETDVERQRWNEKLEASISELKVRNLEVETQLASLAESSRTKLINQEQEIAAMRSRLEAACAALGPDESDWVSSGRVVRLAKKIPGLIRILDFLAAIRMR